LGLVIDTDIDITRSGSGRIGAGVRNGENAHGFTEAIYVDALKCVVTVVGGFRTVALGEVD
jgi:hypothetical protein